MKTNHHTQHGGAKSSIALAVIASLSAANALNAGAPVPPDDWVLDSGEWTLDSNLVGQSVSADSSGLGALEVDSGENATIEDGASWDLNLLDPAAIVFADEGTLTLDGDLTVEADNGGSVNPASVGVLFNSGDGTIEGAGNLSVTSDSSILDEPSLVTAGVLSNGDLDLSEYSGAITVTNDNEDGLPVGDGGGSLPFGGPLDAEIDADKSAVALGVAAVDVTDLLGAIGDSDLADLADALVDSVIFGGINQEVTVAATSRDVFSTSAIEGDDDDDDDLIDANTGAIAVGVVGLLEDGVFQDGAVSATATANAVTAIADDEFDSDSAMANTLGLAVGVGGVVDGISDNASIAADSSSAGATAAAIDGSAIANTISASAAVVGAVIGDTGSIDGGETGTVTISSTSASGDSDADAFSEAEAASGAISVGVGGLVSGGINNAEISTESTSAAANAASEDSLAIAASAAASVGVLGVVADEISNTTITSTATSGAADSEGFASTATSLAAAGGALGGIYGTSEGATIDVTATADLADSEAFFDATAVSGALAIGAGGADELEFVVSEVIPSLLDGFSSDEVESDEPGLFTATQLGGVINSTATSGDAIATIVELPVIEEPEIPADLIESADDDDDASANSYAHSIGFRGDVAGDVSAEINSTATAGNATATSGFQSDDEASADANARAFGIDGDLYSISEDPIPDPIESADDDDDDSASFSGVITVEANAGDATADSEGYTNASADADAQGVGDVLIDLEGDISVTSNAGTATATSDEETASADAVASSVGINDLGSDLSGSITVEANGGTADATSFNDDEEVDGSNANADADAEAYAIDGNIYNANPELTIPADTIEGLGDDDDDLVQVTGELTATANGGTSTAMGRSATFTDSSARAYALRGDDDDDDDDDSGVEADFDVTITSSAYAGDATSVSSNSIAVADADARASGLQDISSFYGSFQGTVDLEAEGGNASAESSFLAFAEADAQAFGIELDGAPGDDDDDDDGVIRGDITADMTLLALGGSAEAYVTGDDDDDDDSFSSANAAASAVEDVVDFYGNFGGTHDIQALSGRATSMNDLYNRGRSEAEATARAYGVNFDDEDTDFTDFEGNFTADVTLLAEAGGAIEGDDDDDDDGANASSNDEAIADASTIAAGMADVEDFLGNFDGSVDATSLAGSANAEVLRSAGNADAYANAEAYAIEFNPYGDDDDDDDDDDSFGTSSFTGDVTAESSITLVATGGVATATVGEGDDDDDDDDDSFSNAGAESNTIAAGLGKLDRFEGNFSGTVDVTADAGEATANAEAYRQFGSGANATAEAEAESVAFALELSGDFGLEAVEERDTVEGDDSEVAVFDADVTINASGGVADATASASSDSEPADEVETDLIEGDDDDDDDYSEAYASASLDAAAIGAERDDERDGIYGFDRFEGNYLSTTNITGVAGTSTASAQNLSMARSNSDVYALDFDRQGVFEGDFDADVTLSSTAGNATAVTNNEGLNPGSTGGHTASASSDADVTVIDDLGSFIGDVKGTHSATATAQEAHATTTVLSNNPDSNASISGISDADADVSVFGMTFGDDDDDDDDSEMLGNFSADVTLNGTSGTANASTSVNVSSASFTQVNAEAASDVSAEAALIDQVAVFTGDFDGSVDTTLLAGEATSLVTVTVADASGFDSHGAESYSDADLTARVIDMSGAGLYTGDFSGDVDIDITAGTAASTTVGDYSDVVANSIDNESDSDADATIAILEDVGEFDGEFSSTVDATATAGDALSITDTTITAVSARVNIGASADADAQARLIRFGANSGDDDDDDDGDNYTGLFSGDVALTANAGTSRAYVAATIGGFGDDDDDDDDSVRLTASDDSDATVEGFDEITSYTGDFTGSLELTAVGGTSTAQIELNLLDGPVAVSGSANADADTIANGFDFYSDGESDKAFTGDFLGDLTATATSGVGYAETDIGDANVDVEALAAGFDDIDNFVGELGGTLSITATGGNGYASGTDELAARAFAEAYGLNFTDSELPGALTGDITSVVTILADGGTAQAVRQDELLLEPFFEDRGNVAADASATAVGSNGAVDGNVTDTANFDIDANAGDAYADGAGVGGFGPFSSSVTADASADAAAIDAELRGNYAGAITVDAVAGIAFADEGEFGLIFSDEPIEGAVASIAFVDEGEFGLIFSDEAIEGEYGIKTLGSSADASASATGIGDRADAVDGEFIAGTIDVNATGGTAIIATNGSGLIMGNDEVESDLFEDTYTFGTENIANNASALAVAIDGNVNEASVTSVINATATGGTVIVQENLSLPLDPIDGDVAVGLSQVGDASAFAGGIVGKSVQVGELGPEGGITATATAGVVGLAIDEEPLPGDDVEGLAGDDDDDLDIGSNPTAPSFSAGLALNIESAEQDYVFAAGVMTYDSASNIPDDPIQGTDISTSLLDIVISTYVHTFVNPATGFELSEESSYNAAVYSGQGDDSVELAGGADIIGDINTGGGLNTVTVTGDTILEGDILSTSVEGVDNLLSIDNGAGTVDFDINAGLFTAVRTVNVSDLENAIDIAAEGGLAPILSQNQGDELPGDLVRTSVIDVTGDNADVNIAAGATVRPVFDESVVFDGLVGQQYDVILTDGTIDDLGALVDGTLTPYNFTTLYTDDTRDTFSIVIDSIRILDEEETPGAVQANDAVSTAAQAVMFDISKHASLLRSLLRRNVQANAGEAPIGAAGPEGQSTQRKMRNGEWLGYVSVFGNIGEQDSEGGFAGFKYDTYGITVGFERLFGDNLIVGVAGTSADTDIDGLEGSGGGDAELYSGAVYVNWFTNEWYAEGGLTYGQSSNDVTRVGAIDNINTLGAFTGSYDSQLFGFWTEVGYTFEGDTVNIEPYARIAYVHGDHDGYQESGPNPVFEIDVQDNETDNFKTELGLRVNHEWFFDNGNSFLLEGKGGWEHEWADNNVTVDTTYLGDSFELQSAESDEDALVLGIRAEWQNGEGVALGLEYEPTFSGNWYNHAFSGTFQFNW